ncbi:hypothetical protein N7499_002728 [Penicillium canescens]|uniref:Uncharacterized protein n=1 Tax=Penicillium canescens TaxID=5083 RepID=A0AAD6N701_PENCN|nr:uncharacterized protein N7446_010364 [Penicillium canescens]KAJ6001358.1 hypothetical protein N7522_006585 [Penicillium canescens]KAJ6035603.1 hypothetical protein N7460_009778 [Penicillium canescens]KAJ6037725.1 hypothetical protein N7444_010430 [Penicillium canescens]KAJ6054352.1 hypothetical protein N7446_010364 [Penicillium canescens]KAJ6098354.1 hypothetical protein N7499_002728 [Penicillium canescens]
MASTERSGARLRRETERRTSLVINRRFDVRKVDSRARATQCVRIAKNQVALEEEYKTTGV